ncbi:MAG: anti-sigma factor [Cereibacter sp.]|jgi:anti-sigma-K factor RskA|nr:anti-sigma factor [Cereibacter sp.]
MSLDPREMADDYVLGLMEPLEAVRFEARMEREPALARAVAQARDRLLPLDLSAPEAALPPGFVERVRAAIAAEPPAPAAANLPGPPARRWVPALAACVGLLAGLVLGWQRPEPEPLVIAVLLDDRGVPQAMVEDYGDDTAQVRFLADVAVPPDRTMQVWTLPSAEMGPVSLGILTEAAATRLEGPPLPRPAGQQLYEITLEPLGGSPTGRPTGPILGKGRAALQDG